LASVETRSAGAIGLVRTDAVGETHFDAVGLIAGQEHDRRPGACECFGEGIDGDAGDIDIQEGRVAGARQSPRTPFQAN
jgi:hypothetical protein